ncbi:MAG: group II intron reverse transcriptase/maturase, partial [Oscillospiraceae bacterium]|nr:group II intron reverse transcriptase/maturase [Oscillospiraceae bacterium]
RTAGVDGYKALTPTERENLYEQMKNYNLKSVKVKPVRRTYIEKKNSKKLRPLGIPVIKCRIYQNIVKNALEPQWEARFEPNSYGFRPKRSTHDAIQNLYLKLSSRTNRKWIFEGDFKGCFDNLSHEHILGKIGNFPERKLIEKWLKAGYVDNNTFHETEAGTPQGGVISPLLANIALHGMESELGVEYKCTKRDGVHLKPESIGVVRYADDFVAVCHTQEQAETIYGKMTEYLNARGISLSTEKTKVTHIEEGFDFLGFNIRQYKKRNNKVNLFIKPSNDSVKKAKAAIKEVFARKRGRPVRELIGELNPMIKGTGYYWNKVVSSKTFSNIDNYIWLKTRKFLKTLHPKKNRKWRAKRYFHPDHNGISKNKWILTDPKNKETQLIRMSWIPIERHTMIKQDSSPDDPTLKQYFEQRDEKEFNATNVLHKQKIAKAQKYKCRVCGQSLIGEEGLEVNHIVPEKIGGKSQYFNLELLHNSCHIQHHQLLEYYGGGRDYVKVQEFFKKHGVDPSTKDGTMLIKKSFKKFNYTDSGNQMA